MRLDQWSSHDDALQMTPAAAKTSVGKRTAMGERKAVVEPHCPDSEQWTEGEGGGVAKLVGQRDECRSKVSADAEEAAHSSHANPGQTQVRLVCHTIQSLRFDK